MDTFSFNKNNKIIAYYFQIYESRKVDIMLKAGVDK